MHPRVRGVRVLDGWGQSVRVGPVPLEGRGRGMGASVRLDEASLPVPRPVRARGSRPSRRRRCRGPVAGGARAGRHVPRVGGTGWAPVTPQTEAQISSLEDISEDALRIDDGAEPASRPAPTSGAKERKPPAGEKARTVPPSEPPVFYRSASPNTPAGSGPVCGDLRGAPQGGRIVFPLERRYFSSCEDTWGAPRTQGGHEGTDLVTPSGVPEYAITDGTVVPVAGSDADGWNTPTGGIL